jgi:hypothetical protein
MMKQLKRKSAFTAERLRQDLPVLISWHPGYPREVAKKQGVTPAGRGHTVNH